MQVLAINVLAVFALSGCAMSAKGLGESKVEATFTSNKPAKVVASCINSAFNWQHTVAEEPDGRWVIIRSHNMYGVPTVRWDVIPAATGSVIELRTSLGMFKGTEKVRACL